MATKARTSRKVSRPSSPPKSNRAKSGEEAAKSRLTTLADRAATSGRAVLVHGPTGSGKTVLAIHKAPRPTLVLDADNGLDSVEGTIDMDQVHIWNPGEGRADFNFEDMDEFRNYVKAGDWEMDYKAIIVDNATAAQKPFIRDVIDEMMEAAASKANDDDSARIDPDNPSRQGWGKVYRKYDKWVTDIRDAKRRGAHVIFTAGTSEWLDTTEGYNRLMPDIEGKERNQIATHFDAVMWLEADEDGRRLQVAPQGAFITKVRASVGNWDKIPEVIEDPDFNSMIDAVKLVEDKGKEKAATKTPTKRKPARKKPGSK